MTLFWEAAQERRDRERRERLTAIYVGVRDGYASAQVSAGVWKGRVDPDYLRPAQAVKTGEDLIREWGHLARPREEIY